MTAPTTNGREPAATTTTEGLTRSAARRRVWQWAPVAFTAFLVVAAYWVGSSTPFRANQLTLWTLLGILALSLTLTWGKAGILSLGQGAFFGIGGYTYGIVAINFVEHTNETLSAVVVAAIVAAVAASFLGYFMFYGEVSGVYVAIITLATSLVLLTFMGATAGPQWRVGEALIGGYNGMVGVPPITVGWPGWFSHVLTMEQMLAATLVLAALFALWCRYFFLRRPFGRALVGLRENEERSRLLGYDTRANKLAIFAVGGALAGFAGAGYAAWAMFIDPTVFGLQQAALVVIWVLVGGRRSLFGAFVGVVLLQWMSSQLGAGAGSLTPIVLGAVLVLVVLALPRGLVPTLIELVQRIFPALVPPPPVLPDPSPSPTPVSSTRPPSSDALVAKNLTKTFGGLIALSNVNLEFLQRGIHCLIGPNGAGKSTLFNLLVGRLRPSSGSVLLGGQDITKRLIHERARLGIGIKLQVPSIYNTLSVAENLWLAAYRHERNTAKADRRVADLLAWLDLRHMAWNEAGTLGHGQQQRLETGMVLATEPRIVLLDEPTAGMTREETSQTAQLVRQLGQFSVVIVVEHDMTFVRQLNAPVTMLHQGAVFVSGTLDELRENERVLDIYLGRTAHA